MGLRAPVDRVPAGERAFMLASTLKALTEGDTPVKIKHFDSSKKKGGSS